MQFLLVELLKSISSWLLDSPDKPFSLRCIGKSFALMLGLLLVKNLSYFSRGTGWRKGGKNNFQSRKNHGIFAFTYNQKTRYVIVNEHRFFSTKKSGLNQSPQRKRKHSNQYALNLWKCNVAFTTTFLFIYSLKSILDGRTPLSA